MVIKEEKITNFLLGTTALQGSKTPDVVDGPDQTEQPAPTTPPLQLGRYVSCIDSQHQPVSLGRGAFGSTWQYQDSCSGQLVAIKRIRLTGVVAPHKRAQLGHHVSAEVLNHQMLRHPHVVRLHEVFLTANHINIVLELANHGSLLELLNKCRRRGGGLPEADARWYFQQMVLALDYLHAKNVCHRDIKLENLLLVSTPHLAKPLVKVADYGCSKYGITTASSVLGTACYMSPEMLQAAVSDTRKLLVYDPSKADLWAASTVLAILLTGRHPFAVPAHRVTVKQRLKATQQSLKLPQHLSPGCRELVRKLLHTDPRKRITLAAIKQHPWFLQDLPSGALDMTAAFLQAPSQNLQSREEMIEVVQAALQVVARQYPVH